MNLEKFTDRSRGFLQAAQTIAREKITRSCCRSICSRRFWTMSKGMATSLIGRAGGAPERVREKLEAALAKLPKITGDTGQVYLDGQTAKVLGEAEKLAEEGGRQLRRRGTDAHGAGLVKSGAKDALDAGAVNAQTLNAAINDLRKGRTADSAEPRTAMRR
jgi:ATP-dependent Clp protease ATP-binding subunit ClpB